MAQAGLDRLAMGLSGLCLVHCLVGTLLVAVASTGLGLVWGHEIHLAGLAIAIPLAIVALSRGVRCHGRWLAAAIGGLGIGFMAGALFEAHGAPAEIFFTMIGVALLAVAHLLNMRWSAAATL